MSASTYNRVLVLGLGAMGRPLAETLLRADVVPAVPFDVEGAADVRDALAAQGAATADTAADAARGADACVIMVQNYAQVRAAPLGRCPRHRRVSSTPSPQRLAVLPDEHRRPRQRARELDAACAERGLRSRGCLVSGGPGASAAGTLSIMIGAPDDTLAAARPPSLETSLGDPARIWQVGKKARATASR
ncbi:MAG: NAD(P)-binding domain-containing protein [Thermomicrobiales bacterium]